MSMPRRANQSRQDAHYHVYNCGVNRSPIFLVDDDYSLLLGPKLRSLEGC